MSDKVIGFLLHEAVASESDVDIISGDGKSVKFRAILQDFIINRNKRLYAEDMLKEGFKAPHVQELIRTRSWFGELDHPITKDLNRQSRIVRSNASHLILDYDFYSNRVEGTIETSMMGRGPELRDEIIKGHKAAFSMRGLGNIVKKNGYVEVKRPFKIITYDNVIIPSHKIAYQLDGTLEVVGESYNSVNESYNPFDGVIIPINADDFKEFYSISENVNTIIDEFDLLTSDSTVKLQENGDVIITSNELTIRTVLEDHITKRNLYREFLSSLKN